MNEQISQLKQKFEDKLAEIAAAAELEDVRVSFLGKNGSITGLLKQMGSVSAEEKKAFGQSVNELKVYASEKISEKLAELHKLEVEREINAMPDFDVAMPADLDRG